MFKGFRSVPGLTTLLVTVLLCGEILITYVEFGFMTIKGNLFFIDEGFGAISSEYSSPDSDYETKIGFLFEPDVVLLSFFTI